MASTPYKIQISPDNTGLLGLKQSEVASAKVSELLQKDLEQHHAFFNEDGFHNHISHHLLALYGTGASPTALQKGYDDNAGYQMAAQPLHEPVVSELFESWDHASKYLGKMRHYPDFLRFFQREIETRPGGWQEVLREYVFSGKPEAEGMFSRLFAGFLHPAIQLMYGVEWSQPAMVAMALAQTAVHKDDLGEFMREAERRASSSDEPMPSVLSLYEAVRADPALRAAPRMSDPNKVRDGVLARTPEEMLRVVSTVRVKEEELRDRTVEMYDTALYAAASAAFHPGKAEKFDFFLMHHVNSAPLWVTAIFGDGVTWIGSAAKVRLLEWKIRLDLVQYAGRASPPLDLGRITAYRPREKGERTPLEILSRLHKIEEDGHAIKLGRATAVYQQLQLSRGYADRDWLVLRGDAVWDRVFHLIIDSVEAPGKWVRTAGLDEAWKDIPDAKI